MVRYGYFHLLFSRNLTIFFAYPQQANVNIEVMLPHKILYRKYHLKFVLKQSSYGYALIPTCQI